MTVGVVAAGGTAYAADAPGLPGGATTPVAGAGYVAPQVVTASSAPAAPGSLDIPAVAGLL